MGRTRKLAKLLMAVLAVCAATAACGGGGSHATDIISAGQVDLQLPPGWKVTHDGAAAPADAASANGATPAAKGATPAAKGATGTIPLAKQDPTTAFFQATGAFTACLKGFGVTFIGTPDPKNPKSPTNDPNYLKSLETCAAQSHILQALTAFQTAQNNLTPKQIQQENASYLRWRTCMIGRGWTVPVPTPDSKGRLFYINASSSGPQLTPPAGEDPISSPDIAACEAQAQKTAPAGPG